MLYGYIRSGFVTSLLLLCAGKPCAEEVMRPAPPCALNHWQSSQAISLAAFRGQVVYLDFWASWCAPCMESLPFLERLQQEFGGRGLQVLGVNLDAERSDAEAFLRQHPVQFTLASNPGAQCPKDFGLAAMPTAYLIDRQGRIRHEHLGFKPSHAAALKAQVEQLLNEPEPAPMHETKP